jgi:uncharacterized protein YjdB
MMKVFRKILFLILIFLLLFISIPVKALDKTLDEATSIMTEQKNNNVDFNYDIGIDDVIKINYNNENVDDVIKKYISSKIGADNISISVDSLNLKYTLSLNSDTYTGNFSYTALKTITIDSSVTDINTYLVEKFKSLLGDVEVIVVGKGNNNYDITINGVTNNFLINQTKSSMTSNIPTTSEEQESPSILYSTHIQNKGWIDYLSDGEYSGTTCQSLRMEAIKIKIANSSYSGEIKYQTYIQNFSWQSEVNQDELSGTTGQGLRMEAIKIYLTGELAEHYDVYYQVYIQNFGMLDWAKNGEIAGSSFMGLRIEGIKIKLLPKNSTSLNNGGDSYVVPESSVYGSGQVQNVGWLSDSDTIGLVGQTLRLEAVKMTLRAYRYFGNIQTMSYIQNSGWNDWVNDGVMSGTVGKSLKMEAIKFQLTGDIANYYDIYYRVYVENYGWLGWTSNGGEAGTKGLGYMVEAVQVKLLSKKADASSYKNTGESYINPPFSVIGSGQVQNIGWMSENSLIGTTQQSLRLETVKLRLINPEYTGSLAVQSYVQNYGWMNEVGENQISGTVGQGLRMEAIKIRLTGDIANYYDIYYRAYIQNYGWMDWAKNGEPAGSIKSALRMESLEIKIVKKGDAAPGSTIKPFKSDKWVIENGITNYYDVDGIMARDFINVDGVKYFFNSEGVLIAKNAKRVIDISAHNGDIDWDTVIKNTGINAVDGVIVRIAAGSAYTDSKLAQNIAALNRLGIPYGIYIYSYAENQNGTVSDLGTTAEGALEAKRVIKTIKDYGINLTYPIYYDLEANGNDYGSPYSQAAINGYIAIVKAFADEMSANGYNNWGIYTGRYYASEYLKDDFLWSKIGWIAEYNNYCYYTGNYSGWQYTSSDSVPGITGYVDSSVFGDFVWHA